MTHALLARLGHLTDAELLVQTSRLAGRGREMTALLVAHLAELDTRRLPLAEGCPSLHVYCVDVLLMSDAEAYLRIEAARIAKRFPVVFDMLQDGSTNLSCLKVLSPLLRTPADADLLREVRGMRKSEVEQLVARLAPKPDVPTTVRRLPVPPPPVPASHEPAPPVPAPQPRSDPAPAPPARAAVAALSPARYSYQLTIDEDTRDLLQLARDLASHAVSPGDDLGLLKRMLELFVERQLHDRFAATDDPRIPQPTAQGSRVPAAVKRAVYQRDRGRCAFVGENGRRCDSRAFLQFHHHDPHRAGGPPTESNLSLMCGPHNRLEEKLRFEGAGLVPGRAPGAAAVPITRTATARARSASSCP